MPKGWTNLVAPQKWSNDAAVAFVVFVAGTLSFIVLLILALVGNKQSNDTQAAIARLAAASMIKDLPGQGCIPAATDVTNGSFWQPLSTGCGQGAPVDYDFTNTTLATPLFAALSSCNVTTIREVHDEIGIIDTSQSAGDVISAFHALYGVDGQPIVYSTSSLRTNGIYPPSLLLTDVVARIASPDGFNFIWLSLHQDQTSMNCLNTTFPLNATTNFNCTGLGWYVTVPFCRTYSCTQGIDLRYYAAYTNYLALYTTSFKGKFYGARLTVTDINAVYSGVIGAFVAVVIATLSYFAVLLFTE